VGFALSIHTDNFGLLKY